MRLLAVFVSSILLLSAQDPPVFKTGVSLVRVDVGVVKDGAAVTGLEQADFIVKDNGKRMAVTGFSREEAPLDLWLLFDVSGSMKDGVEQVSKSAKEAMAQLKPGDRVGVAVFSSRIRTILNPTSDLAEVQPAIRYGVLKQPFDGATLIQEALMRLAQPWMFAPAAERRRAILLITDNKGDRTMKDERVVERLWRADAVMCGLVVQTDESQRRKEDVDKIAIDTGCEMLDTDNPEVAFPEMMKRLRSRYVLYYALPAASPGEEREVEVSLERVAKRKVGEAKILARKGYVAPAVTEKEVSNQ